MGALEPLGQEMQLAFAQPERLHRGNGSGHVIAVGARLPVALAHVVQLLVERKPAGILWMAAVDHIAERGHRLFLACALEPDAPRGLAVDHCDLLARPQIRDRLLPPSRRHPEGDAAAGAAAVETEHEPGPLGRAPMHERIDAQRAMGADQLGIEALQEFEAGPPHQRAIAEDPEASGGGIGRQAHAGPKPETAWRSKRTGMDKVAAREKSLPTTSETPHSAASTSPATAKTLL